VPHADFWSDYAPLASLFWAPFFLAWDVPPLWLLLLVQVSFLVGTSSVLYALLRRTGANNATATFLSVVLFALNLGQGGTSFFLEPFSVFFGLASLLLVSRHASSVVGCLGAGALVAASFLCKQYGVLFLLPGTAFLVASQGYELPVRLRSVAALGLGAAMTVLLVAGYFVIWEETSIVGLLNQWLGRGYFPVTARERPGLFTYLIGGLFVYPLLGIVLYAALVRKATKTFSPSFAASLLGALGGAATLLVQHYNHYHMYWLPFLVFLLWRLPSRSNRQQALVFGATTILALCAVGWTCQRSYKYRGASQQQAQIASKTCPKLPKGSSVFLDTNRFLFIYCDIRNGEPRGAFAFRSLGAAWSELSAPSANVDYLLVAPRSVSLVAADALAQHYVSLGSVADMYLFKRRPVSPSTSE